MQPLGGQNMALNQRVEGTQRDGAGAHLIGQCRQAQIDPFASGALACRFSG
jgi:hypothetical protein